MSPSGLRLRGSAGPSQFREESRECFVKFRFHGTQIEPDSIIADATDYWHLEVAQSTQQILT
jgi:hypothetical protein